MCIVFLTELGGLLKYVRPFLNSISKAKAARLVRSLLDLFLDMEAATGQEVSRLNDKLESLLSERNTSLRFGLRWKGQLGRQDSSALEHVSFFVSGHLILWICSMLCFVSGDCQWSLEFSLHQGHRLILIFEVLYCHTFVKFLCL